MSKRWNVAIIIPCFNEQENVVRLYQEIKNTVYSLPINITPIFINDCSTDNTKQALQSKNIPHLNLSVNLGIGGAVQTGFKYALQNNFDIAVQMDGDGQHPPAELEKILKPIINNQTDVVIGSRYLTKEGFQSSSLRRFGISYFNTSINYWLELLLMIVPLVTEH